MSERMNELFKAVRKKHGKGAILLGSQVRIPARISTGIARLDAIMGGGWPRGRISEVWGPQGSGKTSLMYRVIAALQRAKKRARIAYFDQENTFHPGWAERAGVDLKRLVRVGPLPAEEVGPLLLNMVREGWDLVIIDSIVELLPEKELSRKVEQESVAVLARVLARLLPKVVMLQGESETVVLLVNQVRDRIGFFAGEGTKSPGGNALSHADSLKLRIQRKEPITGDLLSVAQRKALGLAKVKRDRKYGYLMAVRVVKSKVGREGEETRIPVLFDYGLFDGEW